jgi:hypothetical protein
MADDEPFSADCRPTTTGILQCLQMLAEEAENLHLLRTELALRKAIRACTAERNRLNPSNRQRPRRYRVLH